MDHERMAEVFRRLAIEAGRRIMEIRSRGFSVQSKADASPVTEADQAADEIISLGLREAFPGLPLVTEEQVATHREQARSFLIVDPLDGTREFVKRSGDFTVNIAFVDEGRPVRGVVFAPARGRLLYTLADGRAAEEAGGFDPLRPGAIRLLRVAPPDNEALRIVATKSHRNPATEAYLARYPMAHAAEAGSSLKFCLVAAGEADLYPRLGPTMEWDTAAGDALLRGAGGEVARLCDLTPLVYGKAGFANPDFVAYAPGVELETWP